MDRLREKGTLNDLLHPHGDVGWMPRLVGGRAFTDSRIGVKADNINVIVLTRKPRLVAGELHFARGVP